MNNHKAIVKQKIITKRYGVRNTWYYDYSEKVVPINDVCEDIVIWEGDLSSPAMVSGDELYISDLDKSEVINHVIRTTNNEFIYILQNKVIEDEETEKSLVAAEEDLKKIKQESKERRELERLRRIVDELAAKDAQLNWFQKLFKKKSS